MWGFIFVGSRIEFVFNIHHFLRGLIHLDYQSDLVAGSYNSSGGCWKTRKVGMFEREEEDYFGHFTFNKRSICYENWLKKNDNYKNERCRLVGL